MDYSMEKLVHLLDKRLKEISDNLEEIEKELRIANMVRNERLNRKEVVENGPEILEKETGDDKD